MKCPVCDGTGLIEGFTLKNKKLAIKHLLRKGKTYRFIAERTGLKAATVHYHAKRMGLIEAPSNEP